MPGVFQTHQKQKKLSTSPLTSTFYALFSTALCISFFHRKKNLTHALPSAFFLPRCLDAYFKNPVDPVKKIKKTTHQTHIKNPVIPAKECHPCEGRGGNPDIRKVRTQRNRLPQKQDQNTPNLQRFQTILLLKKPPF